MAIEKRLKEVTPQPFTSDGMSDGKITLADTEGFKVKQQVVLSYTLGKVRLEVKRVESNTVLYVGPIGGKITDRSDISVFTVTRLSTIEAQEQPRPSIPEQEIERLTYEEEPTIARRVIQVDKYGNKYDQNNRAPVDPGGQQTTIMNNLLAFLATGGDASLYLVNNDGLFIFDNAGNFIKV